MFRDFETKTLKPYKGYEIQKCYWVDDEGDRMGKAFYLVADEEDYISGELDTLSDAKKFIDEM